MARVIVLSVTLSIPGARSLKEKRMALRSIVDRLRHDFRVSVAETAYQELHARGELTIALVGSDGHTAETLADRIERFLVENGRALVTDLRRERY